MKNNLKKEFHCFLLTDYEKEEEFLRSKHKEGYKFVKVTIPGIYYFEKCEPEDVVYRLDFYPLPLKEKRNYLLMFEDYGWEYMQDMNEFSYFRKSAKNVNEDETHIFSDNESKLDMLKRIFMRRMLPILTIFLICLLPQLGTIMGGEMNGPYKVGLFCFWGIGFLLYMGIILHCAVGFYKLKKKYSGVDD